MGIAEQDKAVPASQVPAVTPARAWRRRRSYLVLGGAASVLVVVVALVFTAWRRDTGQQRAWQAQHTCPGMARANPGVTWTGQECLWSLTEEADILAGLPADTAKVVGLIAKENRRVQADPERLPYVRVAVFMPMTSRGFGDALSETAILHSLQGVYTAQRRANTAPAIVTKAPLVQLTLVNIGRNQEHWERMAQVVESMTGGSHPVVAAVGLGVSQQSTQTIGEWFSSRRIPLVGAALTATNLGGPSFFLTSPSNRDYVAAVAAYLADRHDGPAAGVLFQDITPDDIYVETLGAEFTAQLGSYVGNRRYEFKGSRSPDGRIVNEFGNGRQKVCDHRADVVLFAGRDRDLDQAVRSLTEREPECGHTKPLLVLSAAPGYTRIQRDNALLQRMRDTETTVVEATAVLGRQWIAGIDAPPGFASFHQRFQAEVSGDPAALDDGYAVMNHDALLTVVRAARLSVRSVRDRLPGPADVSTAIRNLDGTGAMSVPGAGGTLAFDDRNGVGPGRPHGKAVPLNVFPDGKPVVPAFLTP